MIPVENHVSGAWRLRRASKPVRFSAASRDQRPDFFEDFLGGSSEPEHDPFSFAVGGKGLASAAGAADARNKALSALYQG